jgi:beta-lactam-binding protein with PASTA domain
VEGGTFPALIWHELMTVAMAGFPVEEFPTPPPSSTTTTLPEIPEEAIVPNLVGRALDDALRLELEEGFWILEAVEIETRDHEPGTIFNQVPASESVVPGGSTITVEIAIEPEILPVPSVIGLTEAEAKQVITSAGFGVTVELIENPAVTDDPHPVGIVWSQDPPADTEGEEVLIVTITVNPEPPPPTTTTTTTTTTEGGGG